MCSYQKAQRKNAYLEAELMTAAGGKLERYGYQKAQPLTDADVQQTCPAQAKKGTHELATTSKAAPFCRKAAWFLRWPQVTAETKEQTSAGICAATQETSSHLGRAATSGTSHSPLLTPPHQGDHTRCMRPNPCSRNSMPVRAVVLDLA